MKINNTMKLQEIEKIVILDRLKKNNGNRTHTAKDLGIGIRTLQRKLARYGVETGSVLGPGTVDRPVDVEITEVTHDGSQMSIRGNLHLPKEEVVVTVKERPIGKIKNISFSK